MRPSSGGEGRRSVRWIPFGRFLRGFKAGRFDVHHDAMRSPPQLIRLVQYIQWLVRLTITACLVPTAVISLKKQLQQYSKKQLHDHGVPTAPKPPSAALDQSSLRVPGAIRRPGLGIVPGASGNPGTRVDALG